MKPVLTMTKIAIILHLGISTTCSSQKISRLEHLGKKVEKRWEMQIESVQRPKKNFGASDYAILKEGIAVFAADGKTISCYDFNQNLLWQTPRLEGYVSSLKSTVDGEYHISWA
jgi:hypothetical protein